MIHLTSLVRLVLHPGHQAERDREVGRYDGVASGAPWLREVAQEAARIAQVPAVAINLVKTGTQRTLMAVGAEVTLLDRRDSMCGAIVDAGHRVHVADASQDARWAGNPFVDGRWGSVRFYGAHPLVAPSGFVVGTLCVLDGRPRELDAWQLEGLDTLAVRVVEGLERHRLGATGQETVPAAS